MQTFTIKNLDCANCAQKIEDKLNRTPGVKYATVNFATLTLNVDTNDMSSVRRAVEEVEPGLEIIDRQSVISLEDSEERSRKIRELFRMFMALALFLVGTIFQDVLHATPFSWAEYSVMLTAYLLSGWTVLISAFRNIRRKQLFDENFLMTVATAGAWLIHEIPEAVGVMIFYMFGEYLQNLAVNRSRRSIKSLLAVRPDQASVKKNGRLVTVPADTVAVGAEIVIQPGERVPLDGVILSGSSFADTSALTGESVPRRLQPGNSVLAGMINQTAMLVVRVEKVFAESSISRVLNLVENASQRKASTEKFITRFARYYSPVVVLVSAAIAIIPPLVIPGATFTDWLYRALVVLVISCPCALVVSIPLGYFGGVGAASRRGILVKGSNFLDVLASVKTVVFDKTGTLTKGVFRVVDVRPANGRKYDEVLTLAGKAEAHSSHPIAQSIRKAAGIDTLDSEVADQFEEIAGMGVRTTINGRSLIAGSDALLHHAAVDHDLDHCQTSGTVVHIAEDGEYAGSLLVDDELKVDAKDAIDRLRAIGIKNIVMLSGDRPDKAKQIAETLGIDEYRAGLLPEQKVDALEGLIARNHEGKIAYVGDGINDAPVIARSDVGIAMGGMGSEAAVETADVVIMGDAPSTVPEAVRIGRRTRQIVWQNIALALGVKAVFIALGIAGEATMWEAVIGDMGVALLAILNSMRILR